MQHRIKANGHELLLIAYPANSTSYRLVSRESREDDVEKLCDSFFKFHDETIPKGLVKIQEEVERSILKRVWIEGYRTAKENSYSEEDMIGLLKWWRLKRLERTASGIMQQSPTSDKYPVGSEKNAVEDYLATLPSKSIQFMSEGGKLSEELLLKVGFKKVFDNEAQIKLYRHPSMPTCDIAAKLEFKTGYFLCREYSGRIDILSVRIEYAHQLQKLFLALTGIELEVTLQNQIIETVPLPDNSEVLGEVKNGNVDFDCSEFVKKYGDDFFWFEDYDLKIEGGGVATSKESFITLLHSQSIDTTKHYVVVKVKN